ncbi:MAG: DoxX family protein, partial [Thiobacillus sp.]
LVPATSVLGAVLLTGYLGGATAVHLVSESPLWSHTMTPVYVGVLVWAGFLLRAPRARVILPGWR